MPHDDPYQVTRASYDAGADAFRERTSDRGVVVAFVERFARAVGQGAVVLDVGCGPGHDAPLLRESGLRHVGVEVSTGMLDLARRHHPSTYVQADMGAFPFRGPVDGVWLNASLLHIPRAEAPGVLRGLVETLRPGGHLHVALKRGDDEGLKEPSYPGMGRRWFTYWQPDGVDRLLDGAGLESLNAETFELREQVWIVRLARRVR